MDLEICIDGPASARAAQAGGADRVELCANLAEGGVTPSLGMIRAVRAVFSRGLMVLIRPRAGDFLYDADELAAMRDDIRTARDLGADGIVIGSLNPDGTVDRDACAGLIEAAGPLEITFHRAFDLSRDLPESLETIAGLGLRRILTSGGAPDAPSGLAALARLVEQAGPRLSIMPGGGVTSQNIGEIVRATGGRSAHPRARSSRVSPMRFRNEACHLGDHTRGREYEIRRADVALVRAAREALDTALS